tara:strand:+ start:500 stop:700 length:201 start_codon:yes stop_codon:yes gene_type:complete
MDIHILAKNQIEAKIVAKRFEIQKVQAELSMGLTPGITISETKALVDGLKNDLMILEYIELKINKL